MSKDDSVSKLKVALVKKKNKIKSAPDDKVYGIIDKIMKKISKSDDISGQELHDKWVDKHGMVPDKWIMKTFKEFLKEDKVSFDKDPKIGWWKDHDHLTVYHGTHERNVEDIKKTGLNRPDPKTGMISVTHDPHTAHGYAAMSGAGGEADFRKAGNKVTHTPHEERAVIKMRIPKKWAEENMDHDLSGNLPSERKRMSDKSEYEKHEGQDQEYYRGTELRMKKPIPPEFIVGHMKRVERK